MTNDPGGDAGNAAVLGAALGAVHGTAPTATPPIDADDYPMRRELRFAAPAPSEPPPPANSVALRFTGTGGEYFRIWIVHLLLMLVTCGIYSAWAKVRKARWFAQHTELMGDRFDFHGDPRRILLGRALALALVLAWTQSFKLSTTFGFVMFALLCGLGPWLFAGAQRFKLANTSWRGLRFGFQVPWPVVYAVCVPLLVVWTASTLLVALEASVAWHVLAGLALMLGFPWAHAQLKQLQHAHARFGEQGFSFDPARKAFYGLYIKAIFVTAVAGVFVALVAGAFAAATRDLLATPAGTVSWWVPLSGFAVGTLTWLCAWPYFAARSQQIVWGHTRWGSVRFAGQMRGWPLWKLAAGQTVLVLLTGGLYWPFAVVNIARYRVQSVVVTADAPLGERVVQGPPPGDQQASGDAAAEFFGLDLGW